jgi:hypothetical protein
MPNEPNPRASSEVGRASSEVGLEAMGYLREANHLLMAAYENAASDIVEDGDQASRAYTLAIAKAWADAELEFRRACMTVAPTIDASLRLVDIESIGERFLTLSDWSTYNPVSIAEVQTFDQHIHELFAELQRQWPELEQQPPLAKHSEDDRALLPPWRLQLERHPLSFIFGLVVVIYVVGTIFWWVLTET